MDHTQPHASKGKQSHDMLASHYRKLIIMALLSFMAMYALMYSMVDSFKNVLPNVNQFYMAGLMTMPMIVIEILLMSSMYTNKKLNGFIIGASARPINCFLFTD